jgi:leader peptidase (prepilin peptidase) / N-methyltransferase
VIGAAVGSFLNVCVYRWPEELGGLAAVALPRLRHPHPLVRQRPGARVAVAARALPRVRRGDLHPVSAGGAGHGGDLGGRGARFGFSWQALSVALFFTILLGIALTDARTYIIPDEFTLGAC